MPTNIDTTITHQLSYAAYLVRLWQDTPRSPWRASAQSVESGEIVRFGSLQALFSFLETQSLSTGQANAPPTEDSADGDVSEET